MWPQVKVEPDVARAHTLPASMYIDPAVLEREKERIFSRTWQLVAHSSELARHGDFKPTTILDEPVLLTHPEDGKLRGFYNVCRHRAAQIVTTRGNRKSLQCGYHGWVYGLDGRLQAAREMEGTEDFDKADFGLVPIQVDTLEPFIFANLDDHAAPLADWIGTIPDEIRRAGYDLGGSVAAHVVETAKPVVLRVGEQDRLIQDRRRLEVAVAGELARVGDELPGAREDALRLSFEDRRVGVHRRRQRVCARDVGLDLHNRPFSHSRKMLPCAKLRSRSWAVWCGLQAVHPLRPWRWVATGYSQLAPIARSGR